MFDMEWRPRCTGCGEPENVIHYCSLWKELDPNERITRVLRGYLWKLEDELLKIKRCLSMCPGEEHVNNN